MIILGVGYSVELPVLSDIIYRTYQQSMRITIAFRKAYLMRPIELFQSYRVIKECQGGVSTVNNLRPLLKGILACIYKMVSISFLLHEPQAIPAGG